MNNLYVVIFFLTINILTAACNRSTNLSGIEPDLKTGSMEQNGINPSVINMADTAVSNGTFPNIHSLLVARNNMLVYEKYWTGKDEKWAEDIGITQYSKDSLHDIRSISKSIVSACIGIALQQGKIKSVDQKVFEFFPEYSKYDSGMRSLLTLEHLLSMTSGIKWNEDVPYNNPENSEVRMIFSGNPVEYVLSQPIDVEPGKQWKYNGGTTQLLAAIIEKTSGLKVDKYAEEYLFKPLGITSYEWFRYPGTDIPAAASGLRLRSRDLLKFGLLYFNEGKWNNSQVIVSDWVEKSFRSQITISPVASYGYQFWLFNDTIMNKPVHVGTCVGNGDQRIFIDRENNLVVVVTAGNYNLWNIENNATQLVKKYVYPALNDFIKE